MPEEKTEKYPPWKELYDTYKDCPYGAFLSFGELSSKSRIPIYGLGWIWTIERFKTEMLRLSNRALESVRKEGYRIVNPNEHTRLCYRETRRAERRIHQGVELSFHVDYEQLNDMEKMQITNLQTRMMTLDAIMGKNVKKVKGITLHYDLPDIPRPQLESKS